jgi:hypothetical protein
MVMLKSTKYFYEIQIGDDDDDPIIRDYIAEGDFDIMEMSGQYCHYIDIEGNIRKDVCKVYVKSGTSVDICESIKTVREWYKEAKALKIVAFFN